MRRCVVTLCSDASSQKAGCLLHLTQLRSLSGGTTSSDSEAVVVLMLHRSIVLKRAAADGPGAVSQEWFCFVGVCGVTRPSSNQQIHNNTANTCTQPQKNNRNDTSFHRPGFSGAGVEESLVLSRSDDRSVCCNSERGLCPTDGLPLQTIHCKRTS